MYYSDKWLIEKYPGMFDPYSGITNNLSESVNDVLKRKNDRKELHTPPDKNKRIIDYCSLGKYSISITTGSSGQVVRITLEISHGRNRNCSILCKITFKQQYIQS